jgi:hypothetical protein
MIQNIQNRQSAAKPLLNGEGSTTISKESTGNITGKQPIYLNVIYKITNIINNKIYIGSASFYDKRKGTHISKLNRNTHKNSYLQASWNKHGFNNFNFEIIEQVDSQKNLLNREQYWLDLLCSYNRDIGYNISKIAGSNLGNKMSEEAKIKIGNFWRGKKFSKERILNIRKARTLAQGKAVNVFNNDMILLYTFDSMSETSRQLNVSIASISKQCNKNINIRKVKYIFRYKDIV